ncbi:MAG: VanZ family protein [Solirubrobacterales bacterium]|nr:VanZ family protein [Solirubrobacterales bacterium]
MGPISRFAPPLAVMALIFYLSAQPGLDSGLSFDLVLRKLAHIAIFAALWLAVARALEWRRPIVASAVALAYAAGDEIHQSFVTDRHGAPLDVAVDALGIGLAVLAWAHMARRRGGRPGPPWPRRWRPRGLRPTASRAR